MSKFESIRRFLSVAFAPRPIWRCFDCRLPIGGTLACFHTGPLELVDYRGQTIQVKAR